MLFVTLLETRVPGLPHSAHQFAHRDFNFSNEVEVAAIIHVNHRELEVLNLFKEVVDNDVGREVWVEVVVDDFSLGNLDPNSILLLMDDALRVRLAERVHVSE